MMNLPVVRGSFRAAGALKPSPAACPLSMRSCLHKLPSFSKPSARSMSWYNQKRSHSSLSDCMGRSAKLLQSGAACTTLNAVIETGNAMTQLHLGVNLSTKRTRKREFLDEMRRVVPWSKLIALIESHYPKGKTGDRHFLWRRCFKSTSCNSGSGCRTRRWKKLCTTCRYIANFRPRWWHGPLARRDHDSSISASCRKRMESLPKCLHWSMRFWLIRG